MIELAVERYAGTGLGHSELCQQMHSHRRTTLHSSLQWLFMRRDGSPHPGLRPINIANGKAE